LNYWGVPGVFWFFGIMPKIRTLPQMGKRATMNRKTVKSDLLAKHKYTLRYEAAVE
jgi:hypothetical protein